MLEEGYQTKRIKELIDKYASFVLMPTQDKSRTIHLCGILAYLELAHSQQMTVSGCIKGLTGFLDKIRDKYIKEEDNKSSDNGIIITP